MTSKFASHSHSQEPSVIVDFDGFEACTLTSHSATAAISSYPSFWCLFPPSRRLSVPTARRLLGRATFSSDLGDERFFLQRGDDIPVTCFVLGLQDCLESFTGVRVDIVDVNNYTGLWLLLNSEKRKTEKKYLFTF